MNINDGPRSDESRPINRFRTHNQKVLVANFLDTLKKEFPVREPSDLERLLQGCLAEIRVINEELDGIYKAHHAGGKALDKKMFKDTAQTRYLEVLAKYSKEELHILMTCFLSDMSVKEFI